MVRIFLLRHAETNPMSTIQATKWHLTERGKQQAIALAKSGSFSTIDRIFISTEMKTFQTALPFANIFDIGVTRMSELDELQRGSGILTRDDYNNRVQQVLSQLDVSIGGWESGTDALQRFLTGVEKIRTQNAVQSVLVISHGIVLSLYFAHLQNILSKTYARWSRLQFCDWGIVEDSRVLKDIV
jgi:broad specificity phosphatase PhoE